MARGFLAADLPLLCSCKGKEASIQHFCVFAGVGVAAAHGKLRMSDSSPL